MNRRTFLGNGLAVGSLVALAGCTEQTLKAGKSQVESLDDLYRYEEVSLPVRQRFELVEEGVHRAEGAEIETPDDFEAYLDEQGFAVEDVSEDTKDGAPILSLEYVADDETERGRALEVGIVAGAYAAVLEAEFDGEELDATLLDPEGAEFGEFAVPTDAAERYNEGAISAATYGKEAMKELQST